MKPSLIILICVTAFIVVVKSQQPEEGQNHGLTAENVFQMDFQPVATVPPPWEPSYQYGEANGVIYGQAPYYPPPYYPPAYGYHYPYYPPPPPYYPPYYYPEYYSQPEVESHQAPTEEPTTTTTTTTTTTPAPPVIVPTPGAFYGPAPLWRQLSRSVSSDQPPVLPFPALPVRQQMRRDVGGRIRCEIYPDTEDVDGSRREGRMRCIIDP